MTELTIDGKKYISSKRAAEITGYAKDYVGQLCREGRVTAKLVGRSWYVLESSIREHRFAAEEPKAAKKNSSSDVDRTWEAPKYAAESAQVLPGMPVKHVEAAQPGTVAAMQTAWQEWFSMKQVALAPEHLLADHEEAAAQKPVEPESVPEKSADTVTVPQKQPANDGMPVSALVDAIKSIAPPEAIYEQPAIVEETGYIDTAPVSIPIERIAQEPVIEMPQSKRVDDAAATATAHEEALFQEEIGGYGRTSAATTLARIVLIVVAILAICIGIIGSGIANTILSRYHLTSYVNMITGSTEYHK